MLATKSINTNTSFNGRLPKRAKIATTKYDFSLPKPEKKDFYTKLSKMFSDPTEKIVLKFEDQSIPKNKVYPQHANETIKVRGKNDLFNQYNTYNEKGQLTKVKEMSNATFFEYDDQNRCTRKVIKNSYGDKISDISYEYKDNGEVIKSVKAVARKDYAAEQRKAKLSINA